LNESSAYLVRVRCRVRVRVRGRVRARARVRVRGRVRARVLLRGHAELFDELHNIRLVGVRAGIRVRVRVRVGVRVRVRVRVRVGVRVRLRDRVGGVWTQAPDPMVPRGVGWRRVSGGALGAYMNVSAEEGHGVLNVDQGAQPA